MCVFSQEFILSNTCILVAKLFRELNCLFVVIWIVLRELNCEFMQSFTMPFAKNQDSIATDWKLMLNFDVRIRGYFNHLIIRLVVPHAATAELRLFVKHIFINK